MHYQNSYQGIAAEREKIVVSSEVFYWSKSYFLSSKSFILPAKVPEPIICEFLSSKKQYNAENSICAFSNLVSNSENLTQET